MVTPRHVVRVPYLCVCGERFVLGRTLCARAASIRAAAAWVERAGTVQGVCPACGRAARARMPVWIVADGRLTRLVPPDHAAAVEGDDLAAVLAALPEDEALVVDPRPRRLESVGVARRPVEVEPHEAHPRDEEATRVQSAPEDDGPPNEAPRDDPSAQDLDTVVVESGPLAPARAAALRAEVVAHAGDGLGAHMGDLREIDGRVRVVVRGALARMWSEADLTAYPIHLRDHGYPLYGLRIVGRAMGQVGCIDAVVDPGESVATEVARVLSQQVQFDLVLLGGGEYRTEVEAPGFERNAVLCLESAQARLATQRPPPSAFGRALETLAKIPAQQRLSDAAPAVPLAMHEPIETAAAAYRALARLDAASRPERSARILETAGVAYEAFDTWRKRVLRRATEFGIAAPRRFWRRLTAAGIVPDLPSYARELARARAQLLASGACDLDDTQRVEAWQRIWDLCERKAIEPPPELRRALGLSDPPPGGGPEEPSSDTAAGVIAGSDDTHARWRRRLLDPSQRLDAIAEVLGASSIDDRTLSEVLEQLDALAPDELLAVIPELPRLGKRVVPGLVARLRSSRREVRQAAAIALGAIGGPEAIVALVDFLLAEPTKAWMDAARALGAHGSEALDVLARWIRKTREKKDVDRLVRALAEIAVADADVCERLERLARDAANDAVARIARAALAARARVREEGRAIRGERPLDEVTVVRGFARRVHEALFVPELDLDDAVVLDS